MAVPRIRLKPGSGPLPEHPNHIIYNKMEIVVNRMVDVKEGVPVKTVKSFLSKVPSVFTGADLIQWLLNCCHFEDQSESIHFAHQLASHGYLFPIDDHVLTVKHDSTFYRFQTPYFWPSNCWEPENVDYAVYLCKRTMQNKAHLELEDFEAENLAKLQKQFSRKWEFIFMQAEAQYKVDKKCDRMERQILDSQERAFWDVHRPPGNVNTTEVDFRKLSSKGRKQKNSSISSPKPSTPLTPSATSKEIEILKSEVITLNERLGRNVLKTSKIAESYITYWDQRCEFDGFMIPPEPTNPWINDTLDMWQDDLANCEFSGRRIRRWSKSIDELLNDAGGQHVFMLFLRKEFAHENLDFWLRVQQLRFASNREVVTLVNEIFDEFLGPTAIVPVNVDGRVLELTKRKLTTPTRWTFDEALDHIYHLMKNDSYQRFLRSDMYKDLLEKAKKKRECATSNKKHFRTLPFVEKARDVAANMQTGIASSNVQTTSASILRQQTSTTGMMTTTTA